MHTNMHTHNATHTYIHIHIILPIQIQCETTSARWTRICLKRDPRCAHSRSNWQRAAVTSRHTPRYMHTCTSTWHMKIWVFVDCFDVNGHHAVLVYHVSACVHVHCMFAHDMLPFVKDVHAQRFRHLKTDAHHMEDWFFLCQTNTTCLYDQYTIICRLLVSCVLFCHPILMLLFDCRKRTRCAAR